MALSTLQRRFQTQERISHGPCESGIVALLLASTECLRNLTMLIGFLTAFPMSLALMFGMTDIDAVLKSSLPSAEIFYQITGSRAIVTFMMCWVILVYFSKHLIVILWPPLTVSCSGVNQSMGHRRTDDLGLCSRRKMIVSSPSCNLLLTCKQSAEFHFPSSSRTSVPPVTFPSERRFFLCASAAYTAFCISRAQPLSIQLSPPQSSIWYNILVHAHSFLPELLTGTGLTNSANIEHYIRHPPRHHRYTRS